jgi:glutamate dehydrogenase/leucine dehydrogenase
MIHAANAGDVNARMIIEGANSPTTPQADAILADNGVLVVPDVLANAGGVIVSYFEWVQNLQHLAWDEREVNDRLGTRMRKAFRTVHHRAREKGESLRVASYALAIERVAQAARDRGYITEADAPDHV